MSALILVLGGRKDKYTAKRNGERHSNAAADCNSELAFIYWDHWRCVGKGLSSRPDSICVVMSVALCSAVLWFPSMYNTETPSPGIKNRSIFSVYILSPEC